MKKLGSLKIKIILKSIQMETKNQILFKNKMKSVHQKAITNERCIFRLKEINNIDNNKHSDVKLNPKYLRANTSSKFYLNSNYIKLHQAKVNDWHVTLFLTIMCLLFVITELPQSILSLLSIILSDWFYNDVYMPLGDLMDMFALLNNSFSFILYFLMSSEFRKTLIFTLKKKQKN